MIAFGTTLSTATWGLEIPEAAEDGDVVLEHDTGGVWCDGCDGLGAKVDIVVDHFNASGY